MIKNSSVMKRDKVSLRNKIRNKYYKSTIKTFMKKFLLEINSSNTEKYKNAISLASQLYSKIDKAVNKGVIKKNSAARKKSIVSNRLRMLDFSLK